MRKRAKSIQQKLLRILRYDFETLLTFGLTAAGKIILTMLMYIGRVGVLTIGFAMLMRMQKRTNKMFIHDDLAI